VRSPSTRLPAGVSRCSERAYPASKAACFLLLPFSTPATYSRCRRFNLTSGSEVFDGQITDQRNVVAWAERRKYVELAVKGTSSERQKALDEVTGGPAETLST